MRAAAAEGFARLRNPADLPMLEKAYEAEGKTAPRLSMAFAEAMLGPSRTDRVQPAAIPDQQSEFERVQRAWPCRS